jgi:hypothetical protein
MSAAEKRKILVMVADSGLPRRKALEHLGLPRSTYYRWLKRQGEGRLQDKKGGSPVPWNKLKPGEARARLSIVASSSGLSLFQGIEEPPFLSCSLPSPCRASQHPQLDQGPTPG